MLRDVQGCIASRLPPWPGRDWRKEARADLQDQAPVWRLSAYSHEGHLPNDIEGDVSPEEVCATRVHEMRRGATGRLY